MSARVEIDDRILRLGNLPTITLSTIRATFGFNDDPQPTKTANVNAVSVNDETARWLASIVGAFDGDPFYARMIENMEENRRRMAAEYENVE
jgi:hypothetical protein